LRLREFSRGFLFVRRSPGGNITGFVTLEYAFGGKWLELLKDTAPGKSRVAVLLSPDNPSQPSRRHVWSRWRNNSSIFSRTEALSAISK
jgi:hypothetical protein